MLRSLLDPVVPSAVLDVDVVSSTVLPLPLLHFLRMRGVLGQLSKRSVENAHLNSPVNNEKPEIFPVRNIVSLLLGLADCSRMKLFGLLHHVFCLLLLLLAQVDDLRFRADRGLCFRGRLSFAFLLVLLGPLFLFFP